jgi:hypothetical protein
MSEKTHLQKMIFVSLLSAVLLPSCKLANSSNKAAESDDWLRKGTDRFYFATAPQAVAQEGSEAKVGQNMIWGIGCKGENKDPNSLVDVPTKCSTAKMTRLPLNERTMVHQFNMADNDADFKNGKCKVLLGDVDLLADVQKLPADYKTGAGAETWNQFLSSAALCGVTLAFMHPVVMKPASAAYARLSTAAGVKAAAAGSALKGFGKKIPFVVSAYNSGAGKWVMGASAAATSKGAGFVGSITGNPLLGKVGNTLLWAFPCGYSLKSLGDHIAGKQTDKNMQAFFNGIAKAEKLADQELSKGPQKAQYNSQVEKGNVLEVLNTKIPAFVRNYNKNTNEKFEQGWELFGNNSQRFFDTVIFLQEAMEKYAEKATKEQGVGGP